MGPGSWPLSFSACWAAFTRSRPAPPDAMAFDDFMVSDFMVSDFIVSDLVVSDFVASLGLPPGVALGMPLVGLSFEVEGLSAADCANAVVATIAAATVKVRMFFHWLIAVLHWRRSG